MSQAQSDKSRSESPGVAIVQRVLAGYRVPFFDELAARLGGRLTLLAGKARPVEMIDETRIPERANFMRLSNHHLFSNIAGGKGYLCVQSDLIQKLERVNPDVLITEANFRYPILPLAMHWMHRRGRPVIGWGLGIGATSNPIKSAMVKRFDAILTYSETGAETYRHAGVTPERIFIAKNAVTRRPERDHAPVRAPEFRDGRPTLLSVGRLQERKRIDLLLHSCAALKEAGIAAPRCHIVGDGPARASLTALAAEVYPEAEFFGAKYGAELDEIFATADLFVLPGTGGLALQQAMANGLPVIAAEADGTQNDLIRADNGRMIPPGDGDALTAAIRELIDDPAQLRAMGKRSFVIVRDEINLEAMADRFEAAIRYVMEQGNKSPSTEGEHE